MRLTPLVLILACGAAAAAGRVEVSIPALDRMSDAGHGSVDAERNVKALAAHLQQLAPRLADGQVLEVELRDVDLAGRLVPLRNGSELRVMKGSADWPALQLRWSLKVDARVLRSADERISDMAYLATPLRGARNAPLGYEMRLIDRWFNDRFGDPAAAGR